MALSSERHDSTVNPDRGIYVRMERDLRQVHMHLHMHLHWLLHLHCRLHTCMAGCGSKHLPG